MMKNNNYLLPSGVAAYNIGGTTLHEWAGVGQSISKVEDLLSKIDRSKELLSRWRYTKTLVIDEM
jgi:ATP-dependent DNA helicase PIF1